MTMSTRLWGTFGWLRSSRADPRRAAPAIRVRHRARPAGRSLEYDGAIARWNLLWESAQYRRRHFGQDDLPESRYAIADRGDINVMFVPRTPAGTTNMRGSTTCCPGPRSTVTAFRSYVAASGLTWATPVSGTDSCPTTSTRGWVGRGRRPSGGTWCQDAGSARSPLTSRFSCSPTIWTSGFLADAEVAQQILREARIVDADVEDRPVVLEDGGPLPRAGAVGHPGCAPTMVLT